MGCGLLALAFLAITEGFSASGQVLAHTILTEYVPFMVLLGSLYIVAGGIALRGDFTPTPATNTGILASGAILASVLGTTGASVLFIRLLIDTNRRRTRVAHTVVFFIFIVSNVGGLLLPIGDPPLFLGYLRGVPFFWTLNMWPQWIFTVALLLAIYFVLDTWLMRHETATTTSLGSKPSGRIQISGWVNFLALGGILASVIVLIPGRPFPGTNAVIPSFAREIAMCLFAAISLWMTPTGVRAANKFSWGPILEVAALFIGIFVAMQVPMAVLAEKGAELGVTSPAQFFWVSGTLSSFLDNAPTYLVFLTIAASLPVDLGATMITLNDGAQVSATLLTAISLGSVFMGANTYIGNGPNFMVKAMAEEGGVRMPSFFGFMGWSIAVLIPVFVLVTILFEY